MSIWFLLQIVVNIFLVGGVSICLVRVFKNQEDDSRLTHGLRLLQSKISILEDLSDHTENQVKQLMTLLDKKLHEVRGTMHQVDAYMGEVDRSIEKGRKIAEEFQNDIAHDQIVEKKLENKYIQAAQLAHQGHSVEEIVSALNLPKAEVELIAKINKKKCVYEAKKENLNEKLFSQSLEMPKIQSSSQAELDFKQAIDEHNEKLNQRSSSGFRSIKLG